MNRLKALWALLRLLAIVMPLWMRGQLTIVFGARRIEDEGQTHFHEDGHVVVYVAPNRDSEEAATLLHELYHVAQRVRCVVAPVPMPYDLPPSRQEAIRRVVARDYEPEYHAVEAMAESWSRAVAPTVLALLGWAEAIASAWPTRR